MQTVSLSFFRFSTPLSRLWALAQMGAARLSLPGVPDIGFWKLLGSGTGEGFTPIPNTGVYAILATWPSEEIARGQTSGAPVFRRYQSWANEHWTVFLSTASVRGNWAGTEPFQTGISVSQGPLAALTRATVKPRVAWRFWKRVPAISDVIGSDPNVVFKIGVGEVPLLHQVTFSIWPDANAMANFARKDGPHARAIKAVRAEHWFREELYARFNILGSAGSWNGRNPLQDIIPSEVAS
ncbi:spheroidene monooxygenase [Litoreibacter ponti]|uniref:spheroidene monooxygenase n=1 Tax=Litoreibacter ponti TaxID=1510457 RepID=UPI000D312EAF